MKKEMKKAALVALSLMLMGIGSLKAQIFMTNAGNDNNRSSAQVAEAATLLGEGAPSPNNLAPIGGGMAILAGLAGCYLLGKKNKRN